ncbi:MAG TPA: response regulator [Kofleriaceae bacterium]|jgi:two-component system KDP operon response regulator KdpE
MSTILVVDDDLQLRRFLRTTLTGHGHSVAEAGSVAEAIDAIARVQPQVILLDLGLPDGDGLTVLHRIPAETRPPVIVLSARGQEGDKVTALDAGAEDYLTKPFGASELLARIRVVLRRAGGAPAPDVLEVGPIRIDQPRHSVTVDAHEVHLTPIEFRLLLELARHPGRVLTHRQLLREIWGPNAVEEVHYLRVHMAALRRKVEADPARPRWLLTEAGVGYRMREPAADA